MVSLVGLLVITRLPWKLIQHFKRVERKLEGRGEKGVRRKGQRERHSETPRISRLTNFLILLHSLYLFLRVPNQNSSFYNIIEPVFATSKFVISFNFNKIEYRFGSVEWIVCWTTYIVGRNSWLARVAKWSCSAGLFGAVLRLSSPCYSIHLIPCYLMVNLV